MLNCVLFWWVKEWKPHSKGLFFSWYGEWGAKIKLTASNIKVIIGIITKKKSNTNHLCIKHY